MNIDYSKLDLITENACLKLDNLKLELCQPEPKVVYKDRTAVTGQGLRGLNDDALFDRWGREREEAIVRMGSMEYSTGWSASSGRLGQQANYGLAGIFESHII